MDRGLMTIEIYKCFLLTVIAIALVAIWFKTPTPFTFKNLTDNKVDITQIPIVRVQGGNINADVTGRVEIER